MTATKRIDPLPDDAPHILVVDDDQRIRDLLSRYLFEHGFRVTPAGDAAEARAAMRGLSFDLIILDVMMPGESGLSLARDLMMCPRSACWPLASKLDSLLPRWHPRIVNLLILLA